MKVLFLFKSRLKLTIALTLCLSNLGLHASDDFLILETLDGNRYTNARITSVTAAYAIVLYGDSSGVRIAFTNLSKDLQKRYHYDPDAASNEVNASEAKKKAMMEADLTPEKETG